MTRSDTSATQFTLHNVQQIDNGKVALALNQALRQAAEDIQERPGDKSKRQVVLQVNLTPELERELGVLDLINAEFEINVKIPKRRSTIYPMLPGPSGVMTFQPHAPMDPRQEAFSWRDPSEAEAEEPPETA